MSFFLRQLSAGSSLIIERPRGTSEEAPEQETKPESIQTAQKQRVATASTTLVVEQPVISAPQEEVLRPVEDKWAEEMWAAYSEGMELYEPPKPAVDPQAMEMWRAYKDAFALAA